MTRSANLPATSSRPTVIHARVVTGTGGGADKTVLNSPRFLKRHGYNTVCLFLRHPEDEGFHEIEKRAQQLEAPLVAIDDFGIRDPGIVRRVLSVCRDYPGAIWHAHEYKTNLLGLILRRFHKMTLVSTVHGWGVQSGRTPLYHQIDRWTLPWYAKVVCVSRDLAEQCQRYGVSTDRLIQIDNGIDTQFFQRKQSVDAAKLSQKLPTDRVVIGAAGRLSSEKAFDLLIRVVDRLIAEGRRLTLVIVGEGPEEQALRRLIQQLGRENDVQLLGFRSDIAELFQAFDMFVLSSLREGLPNVILEAMALEVPVVASNIAGLPYIVSHGESGLLVPAGNETALTEAIIQVLDDPILAAKLAKNGRVTIEQRFSFERRMERIACMYDELIAATAKAR